MSQDDTPTSPRGRQARSRPGGGASRPAACRDPVEPAHAGRLVGGLSVAVLGA